MTKPKLGHVMGVDVGGTFTDLIALDQSSGEMRLSKVPSTLDNQAFGVMQAIETAGIDLSQTDLIVHGTTTTTNAVLERKLSRTGLITTRGFRDVLELGRRTRPHPYGMIGSFEPVIARNLRLEVPERMDAQGAVVAALDEAAVRQAGQDLLEAGCISVVIHFLHAYANPAHELRCAEILQDFWPNAYITMGHTLLLESREFERGVTAAVNASVQPLLERYIAKLGDELSKGGYQRDLLVMNGNGGMVSSGRVSAQAAKTVMSGPASGVMAAAYTGRAAAITELITYDMGGTSTDVSLIRDAEPSVSSEIEIEYAMPIHVPMVDVRTVGAGGGSIIKLTQSDLLEVGPESAGADPGPICYGRGGTQPTISDANMLLGRLDPSKLTSVSSGVTLDDIDQIFAQNLGRALGLSGVEAAAAAVRLANIKMAGAIRMVSVSLGVDPRDFALFAFGGAGPLHAAALARELAVPRVLVPARPGITNALGCLVADLRKDFTRTVNAPLDQFDMDQLHDSLWAQEADGRAQIAQENIEIREIRVQRSVDMQFLGQTHLIRVPLEQTQMTRDTLRARFDEVYFARFKTRLDGIPANLVNINSSVIGKRAALDLSLLIDPAAKRDCLDAAKTGLRSVHFYSGRAEVPIYWRDHLPAEFTLPGPAIIEQFDTTILIEPGDHAQADAIGNIIITVGDRP